MKNPIAHAIIIAALPSIHYSAIAQDGAGLATRPFETDRGSFLSSV